MRKMILTAAMMLDGVAEVAQTTHAPTMAA